jgi:hypothetical protein
VSKKYLHSQCNELQFQSQIGFLVQKQPADEYFIQAASELIGSFLRNSICAQMHRSINAGLQEKRERERGREGE